MENKAEAQLGKIITAAHIDDGLFLTLADGTKIVIRDDGQSCCEHRYVTCDDDAKALVGKPYGGYEVKGGPEIDGEYGEPHETAFVEVKAGYDSIVMTTHNEHNGYYGGFRVQETITDPA